jgi:tRNA(Ile)-lysidine synthase
MTTSFEEKLINKIKKFSNKKILVAFSGGKDSVALLHFLKDWRAFFNLDLAAVHVNHNLRSSAIKDEDFCKSFCEKFNLPLFVEMVDVKEYVNKTGSSIEEASRVLRYKRLYEVLSRLNYDYLLVAHNKDDLVESFFIKIFQGASIFHLEGFNNEYKIERPMLCINTAEILEYINNYSIKYIIDETNYDNRFLRNWVRHNLIPVINEKNGAFLNNIRSLQIQSKRLCNYMDKKADIPVVNDKDVCMIKMCDFDCLDVIEKEFTLSKILSELFRVEKKHIENAMKIINSEFSRRLTLPCDFILEKTYHYIYIYKNKMLLPFYYIKERGETSVFIDTLQKTVVFSGNLINEKLVIRNRRKGDTFGGKKIKDIYINKKVDLLLRDTAILVENDTSIIWAEHISKQQYINIASKCKNENKLFVN